jgi:hypothetical protein
MSRLTVASLADMGYQVDLDEAEPYELPDLMALAERGVLVPHMAPLDSGTVLPMIPHVLPSESLV